jgi:zinc transport system substrate-binding protein
VRGAVFALLLAGALAGCVGDAAVGTGPESDESIARASFFVFGDVTEQVAGDAATAELLVPIGQHGHGWEPGPSVREDVRTADVFVHGMDGFQPWIDDIVADLEADGADVKTVDVSAGIDLLDAGARHDDDHDEHGGDADPHFWMDPLRVTEAVETVRQGLTDADPENADDYAANADAILRRLDDLNDEFESTVADASIGTILVAGHDSFQYFGDRYGVDVEALTDVSPDDRPTPRDIGRAREIVERHGLRYVCADPLESQRAAEQLVAETDAEAVLPLTAMPGLTETWKADGWGYVEVMENVNLPTLERALGVR